MKIVEHTDLKLEIADRNRQYLWGLLLATPFLAIGLGTIAMTAKTIVLECQRDRSNDISCQQTVTGILGTETKPIPGNLKTATTVKTSGTGVVLGTTTDRVELAPYRTFVTERHHQTVDRLNAFIQDPQQSKFRIEQDDRWGNLLWSCGFLSGGVITAIASLAIPLQVSCKFDRTIDRVILSKKYLLYGNRQTELPLSKVERVRFSQLPFYINHRPVYSLNLVPAGAKKISLSVPIQDLSLCQDIADETNDFLRHH